MNRPHETVTLQCHLEGKTYDVEIDKGIASLIEEMWKLDIRTSWSCENYSDFQRRDGHSPEKEQIRIDFYDVSSFERFLNVVGDIDDYKNQEEIDWHKKVVGIKEGGTTDFIYSYSIQNDNEPKMRAIEDEDHYLMEKKYQKPTISMRVSVKMLFPAEYLDRVFKHVSEFKSRQTMTSSLPILRFARPSYNVFCLKDKE